MHFINIVHELYLIVLEHTWAVVFAWTFLGSYGQMASRTTVIWRLNSSWYLSTLTWIAFIFSFLLRAQLSCTWSVYMWPLCVSWILKAWQQAPKREHLKRKLQDFLWYGHRGSRFQLVKTNALSPAQIQGEGNWVTLLDVQSSMCTQKEQDRLWLFASSYSLMPWKLSVNPIP